VCVFPRPTLTQHITPKRRHTTRRHSPEDGSFRGQRHENPNRPFVHSWFCHFCGGGSSETAVFLYELSFHQRSIVTFTHLPSMLYSLRTDIVNKPQKQTHNTVNCSDYLMVYVTLCNMLSLVKKFRFSHMTSRRLTFGPGIYLFFY
jgi:hypothetical protein